MVDAALPTAKCRPFPRIADQPQFPLRRSASPIDLCGVPSLVSCAVGCHLNCITNCTVRPRYSFNATLSLVAGLHQGKLSGTGAPGIPCSPGLRRDQIQVPFRTFSYLCLRLTARCIDAGNDLTLNRSPSGFISFTDAIFEYVILSRFRV